MRRTIAIGGGVLFAVGSLIAQAPAVTRTPLQRADLSIAGREVVTARGEFPAAGSTVGRHTHPGEEVTYVVEGTLTLEIEGTPNRTLKAGDVFIVPAGKVHNATAVGGKVTLIANYIVEKGKPLVSPVQ